MDWIGPVSMLTRRRSGWWCWGLAAALLAVSVGIRFLLARWVGGVPYLVFFPALIAAALFCGWAPALAVLVASSAVAWFFSLPRSSPYWINLPVAARLTGFLVVGGLEIALISALAALVRRLERATQLQDTLFSELQHRVANNMNIIAGMLQHTRRALPESPATEIIDQAAARITAMAQLHRRLYDSRAYDEGLEPVLRDVLAQAFHGLPVQVSLRIARTKLSIDRLTAITLLVNEAALNAVKHVFRAEQGTAFEVALEEMSPGRLVLTVRDDGPGLGRAAAAGGEAQRLGMNIMRAFAGQLGGGLEMPDGPGATLRVAFAAAADG